MGSCLCCPGDVVDPSSPGAPRQNPGKQKAPAVSKLNEERLLLLGAGECGKSTVLKQMRVLYADGFTDEERAHFKNIIRENALKSIATILTAMKDLGIDFENDELDEKSNMIRDFQADYNSATTELPADVVSNILAVWLDTGLQSCFLRSNEYQLMDSAQYFIEKIEEISKENYVPSEEDMLRVREQTQGIKEAVVDVKNDRFQFQMRITDVGGQRNKRQKWSDEFVDVTALIFVASLADYDLTLQEPTARGRNRMEESLELFKIVIGMNAFKDKNIILFLNKTDLFRKKVPISPIEKYFENYTDGPDYRKGVAYFMSQFESMNYNRDRRIYPHPTCATDTHLMRNVIFDVTNTIIQLSIQQSTF